ncbi:MAG: hypothetical protein ISS15_13080 [Alphaproteobacteria bacterium]|nr:hypothetical protein [Alphaproteobacteria bacterium]MBL6936364.1 hypothetical protein [Alphaproteobacteria bacterium]MBL7098585.1 hypothetical protein [Alphaproteobacteria bacterium]
MARLSEPTGSLADGADRFDRLIKGVKDRQFSEVHNAPTPKSLSNAFVVSPEEAWSKKFMTAGIGPQEFVAPQMPSIALAAPLSDQTFNAAPQLPAAAVTQGEVRPASIGQARAKPARRRSWVGRFFFGD